MEALKRLYCKYNQYRGNAWFNRESYWWIGFWYNRTFTGIAVKKPERYLPKVEVGENEGWF